MIQNMPKTMKNAKFAKIMKIMKNMPSGNSVYMCTLFSSSNFLTPCNLFSTQFVY